MFYVATDFHLNHHNILRLSKRPFDTIEDMNQACIKAVNARVRPDDTLIYLGDFCWDKTPEQALAWWSKFNCKKWIFLEGNHDDVILEANARWNLFDLRQMYKMNYNKQFIHFCHFPILDWDRMYHGSYMFHGHSHANMNKENVGKKRLDVGFDSTKQWVISLDEALDLATPKG